MLIDVSEPFNGGADRGRHGHVRRTHMFQPSGVDAWLRPRVVRTAVGRRAGRWCRKGVGVWSGAGFGHDGSLVVRRGAVRAKRLTEPRQIVTIDGERIERRRSRLVKVAVTGEH